MRFSTSGQKSSIIENKTFNTLIYINVTAPYIYHTESLSFLIATPVIHLRKYFIYSIINEKSIPEIINIVLHLLLDRI